MVKFNKTVRLFCFIFALMHSSAAYESEATENKTSSFGVQLYEPMENADSSQVQVSKFQVSETQVSQVQVRNHAYFHCLSGYTWNPDANICEDDNECASNNGNCGDANIVRCSNNPGSFSCQCRNGYTGVAPACIDFDECLNATSCPADSICLNSYGSFSCYCNNTGYAYNGSACDDVDECQRPNVCPSDASCANTVGSYNCVCNNNGYNYNGTSCVDIDECVECPCDIHADCTNTIGSFNCNCRQGYNGTGLICNDIDECVVNNGGCGNGDINRANCININSSFICTCNCGFSGPPLCSGAMSTLKDGSIVLLESWIVLFMLKQTLEK